MTVLQWRNVRWFVQVLLLLALAGPVHAAPPEEDQNGAYILYEFKEDDTLASLADEYLGGPEYLPELMAYNHIRNPAAISEGFILAIPRTVRNRAISELSRAENALAAAMDADAETYAPYETRLAGNTVQAAREARQEAAYDKSIALSELAILRAQEAKRLADHRAPVQQDAKVTFVQGDVAMSEGDRDSWLPVSAGDALPVAAILRTGEGSRAEVTLADGSIIQVVADSSFQIKKFLYDRRNGKRDSLLKVILGGILGRIHPEEVEESEFEVESGGAAIAIRGTELRVGADEKDTALVSVLEGDTLVSSEGRDIEVPGEFGTYVRKGKPPAPARPLLPPPVVLTPAEDGLETAAQTIEFSWEPVESRRASGYHIEIARDENFNAIVQDFFVEESSARSAVMEEGLYYWHVSTRDDDGLEGDSTLPRSVLISKNLAVQILSTVPPFQTADTSVVGPQCTFMVRPEMEDTSVISSEYRIGEGEYMDYSVPFVLPLEGSLVIEARGQAADGEIGPTDTMTVEMDATPPQLSLHVGPSEPHPEYERAITVAIQAVDRHPISELVYKINREPYRPYTEPLVLDAYQNYTLRCRATDVVGNVSPEKKIQLKREWAPAKPVGPDNVYRYPPLQ